MDHKNYYAILGVSPSVDQPGLRRAFREKTARQGQTGKRGATSLEDTYVKLVGPGRDSDANGEVLMDGGDGSATSAERGPAHD